MYQRRHGEAQIVPPPVLEELELRGYLGVEMEVLAPSHCASRRAERCDESVSASEAEGFRGRYHSIHGRAKQGAGRQCGKGSNVCKEDGGREGLEAVDHGWREEGKSEVVA